MQSVAAVISRPRFKLQADGSNMRHLFARVRCLGMLVSSAHGLASLPGSTLLDPPVHPGITYALYKPDGYLSQFVNNGKMKKHQRVLGELFETNNVDMPPGIMPVGRLDEMSEGLLLLTTNGHLSYSVTAGGIEKEYFAQVDGLVTGKALQTMESGLDLNIRGTLMRTSKNCVAKAINNPTLPPRTKKIRDSRHGPMSWLSVTIAEGKYRQVRRMTASVGYPTLRLVRVRIGDIHLGDLQPGELRLLDESEVSGLLDISRESWQ